MCILKYKSVTTWLDNRRKIRQIKKLDILSCNNKQARGNIFLIEWLSGISQVFEMIFLVSTDLRDTSPRQIKAGIKLRKKVLNLLRFLRKDRVLDVHLCAVFQEISAAVDRWMKPTVSECAVFRELTFKHNCYYLKNDINLLNVCHSVLQLSPWLISDPSHLSVVRI